MKKKGFTLIELLGVIVVLAIIALIAVPTILGVIDKAKKGAFKDSILGIMEAGEIYLATTVSTYDKNGEIAFTCNGDKCINENGQELNFKGEVPISGQLKIKKNGVMEAYYLKNKDYCAVGERVDLNIMKDCNSLDKTAPELTVNKIKSTTNQIVINVKTSDLESGIKKIEYEIDGQIVEQTYNEETKIEETKKFENLENNKTYEIIVRVTNGNNGVTTETIEVTTLEVNSPTINITGEKVTDGYYKSIVGAITYDGTNIENPEYFVKTTKIGTSSIDITESCGLEIEPTTCTTIDSTTTLNPNVWYKVSGDLEVTYTEPSTEIGELYALTYDGAHYIASSVATISKISYKASEVDYSTSYNEDITNVEEAIIDLEEKISQIK